MKKLLLLFVILSIASVSCEGTNSTKCLESVKKAFPHSSVFCSPESNLYFVVIDSISGTVQLVKTGNMSSPDISEVNTLIKQ